MRVAAPYRYYGGKGRMRAKLLPLIPAGGRPYVEPYFGAGSVFFARQPAPVEVINDINGDVANTMRCLQEPETFRELKHRLLHTLYSRAELERSIAVLADPNADRVLRAWAFVVNLNMAVSGQQTQTAGRWSRTFTSRAHVAATVNKWLMRLAMLDDWHRRLLCAQIDNRDAIDVIDYWDSDDAVFYLDPPYHLDTRKGGTAYRHEADHDHHERLVERILRCRGAVVLSGYAHDVYAPLDAHGWRRIEFQTACHAASRNRGSGLQGRGAALAKVPRTEVVWLNTQAAAAATDESELF